ncbi:FHA domain-containing protein [Streptomyces sp. NPDC057385]|uniref:FHA domain-containing protein n=2 Tax=unclassified Streptomyces TaxID=2593676 RepID=UPI0036277C88
MQIRLTVVDPLAPAGVRGRAASCDVLVTAPAGTALAAVASGLAAAVQAGDGPVVLYAGAERLDAQRCTLGEPPLTDGAVLSLGSPALPEPHPELDDAPAQLHVVAGPDAGGVHLLHGGEVRVGRSADADVPLDDPDVSRLHCAVTLAADGRVTVADLGSTNGTVLDGTRVDGRPVRVGAGSLLRIGESALRLAPPGGPGGRIPTTPDGEGHVRVPCGAEAGAVAGGEAEGHAREGAAVDGDPTGPTGVVGPSGPVGPTAPTVHGRGDVSWSGGRPAPVQRTTVPEQAGAPGIEGAVRATGRPASGIPAAGPASGGHLPGGGSGQATHGAGLRPHGAAPNVRGGGTGGRGPGAGEYGTGADGPGTGRNGYGTTAPAHPVPAAPPAAGTHPVGHAAVPAPGAPGAVPAAAARGAVPAPDDPAPAPAPGDRGGSRRGPAAERGPAQGTGRRRGLGAWARRLAGGRGGAQAAVPQAGAEEPGTDGTPAAPVAPGVPETWPDPAALLLTALGPGPRLWERGPGHPEALTVRLGTADRPTPDGTGLLPAVPVTAGLREAGALGLAGPRPRLSGLARAVVAQLAALHSPDTLEIVLISVDRTRSLEERTAEWAWLGWLPHVRPGHGQDCRLLLAYDREQAAARTDELLRRLADHDAERTPAAAGAALGGLSGGVDAVAGRADAPLARSAQDAVPPPGGPGAAHAADPGAAAGAVSAGARRPSWARADDESAGAGFPGPYTVVVVDGDPGGPGLQEAVARLAAQGPRAGIHVVCLAETDPASPASPVTQTFRAACEVSPVFAECGAVALLSGDVATALRLLRVARREGVPVGDGTLATVDAVSAPWAERFARALAPLRPDGPAERHARVSAPLPQSARLLEELGLARATPASLMARWADAADDTEALGGRARAVLGAGPRGPVGVDLVADGPHLLIEGPHGSGRTELLRAVVASLASAERPDRLGIVLMDGRDRVGGATGDGLRVCTDVPHVTTHLIANDPVRMREFAQSLSAELKRRAELLGRTDFAEWHRHREVSGRIVAQRTPASGRVSASGARTDPPGRPGQGPRPGGDSGAGDIEAPPSSTLRLRPSGARRAAEAAPPLPRLVVVVDDLDALVAPSLGSPGRPAAGSVMRALEAVARDGERLGVHLVAASGPGGRTAESEAARRASLRVALDAPGSGPDDPAPGRGRLTGADGRVTPFQAGRVTGRIPRTATLRPTVVPLEWHRMGDPPARRPVRELGNGPTDLALLASALERAAREVSAAEVPSLI